MVGGIYLANIYFTDASAAKVRPVLLLKPNSFNDMLFLPLTSNLQTNGIAIDNSNMQEGYLPKASVAVYEKPGVIAPGLLIKKIGVVHPDTYSKILDALVQFLKG